MKKKGVAFILLAAAAAVGIYALQCLLVPKYMGAAIEGAFIKEYYDDEPEHDVIFLGDCEVYENISPVKLWEEYGITSYIRGSANQLVSQSYFLLKDTLRYEKPEIVVLNVLAMGMEEQEKEAYNRMTMEGMRWSKEKLGALNASMMSGEHMIEYVFPILRYHSRWKELTKEDIIYYGHRDKVSHNGYYMRMDVRAAETFPRERPRADYTFSPGSWEYLDRIRGLCDQEGITLVLMKAPSLYPVWYDQWEQQIEDYASRYDLLYLNFLEDKDAIGLDYEKDTYDGGLHLNLYGAEKLSVYLGDILRQAASLPDHRGDVRLSALWEEKISFYNKMKQEQLEEIESVGYIRRFHIE